MEWNYEQELRLTFPEEIKHGESATFNPKYGILLTAVFTESGFRLIGPRHAVRYPLPYQGEVTVKVSLPDDLKGFIEKQVSSGGYPNPDAFITKLLHDEAAMFERVSRGEPLPIDEHLERRMKTLLDEAEASGDYIGASKEDFDAMEREALELVRRRKSE